MSDLSQQLLSEHIAGIPFPIPPGGQKFPLPVFLAGNITEQLYRTQYVLSLALKLTPLEETLQVVTTSRCRHHLQSLLERSQLERKTENILRPVELLCDVSCEEDWQRELLPSGGYWEWYSSDVFGQ